MSATDRLILGEYRRALDQRWRVAVPGELAEQLTGGSADCFLAKERSGCLSLWAAGTWQAKLHERVKLVEKRLELGDLDQRIAQVQMLGRLLSTRHAAVQLDKQNRVLVPKEFREFFAVELGGEVLVVGAGVCVELWNPLSWLQYIEGRMPRFRRLFQRLSQ